MASFAYRAIDRDGRRSEGQVQADDRADALVRVRAMGVIPVSLVAADTESPSARGGSARTKGPPVAARGAIAQAFAELAVLTKAGLTLERALSLCNDNIDHGLVAEAFGRLHEDVRQGVPLSVAMARQSGLFAGEALAIVEAGEANGALGDALSRVATMMEREEALRRTIVGAMIYPAALALLAIAVILLMLLYVVPQFETLFATARDKVPASSRALMAASTGLRDNWPFLLAGLITAYVAARVALARPSVQVMKDRLFLRLPHIGTIVSHSETARFARTTGGLITGGVAVPTALSMGARALRNSVMRKAVEAVADTVKEGGALTTQMRSAGLFPRVAIGFLRSGEETSQLGPMLERLAEVMERDVRQRIDRLVAIVTPLITIALGGGVAAIIASIMSAILGFNDLAVNQ